MFILAGYVARRLGRRGQRQRLRKQGRPLERLARRPALRLQLAAARGGGALRVRGLGRAVRAGLRRGVLQGYAPRQLLSGVKQVFVWWWGES